MVVSEFLKTISDELKCINHHWRREGFFNFASGDKCLILIMVSN